MANEDGSNPGEDTDATKKGGKGDDANADKNAEGKKTDSEQETTAGQVVFKSQKEVDDMIARRVARATKEATENAKLSETELLKRERDEALKLVRDRDQKDDFITQSGLEYGKAARLFKMYRDDLEVDDAGKVTNMKDVIASVKKDFPEYFKKVQGKADGSDGSDGTKAPAGDMNSVLRKMAGRG